MSTPEEATAGAVPPGAGASALLAHDLRAALSDVLGGLRLIGPAAVDGETAMQLGRVRAAAEELARLIERGLGALVGDGEGGADSGQPVALDRLLRDIEMRWSGRARERGLGFSLAAGAGLPAAVALDRIALERILSNLLMNAVNYADCGSVRLSVAVDGTGTLRFTVSDDGPGFPPAVLEGGGRPQGRGGTGLGLQITRVMAQRLAGTVQLANRPGGGAEATLAIPRTAWEAAAAAGTGLPEGMPDLAGQRVLVAEDSATGQAVISAMLARLGAVPVIAADGVEAIERLSAEPFAMALIDIEMPRLSGLDVIRRLRALDGPAGRMPVLAVTAYVLRANREAILAAGADGILPKPVHGLDSLGHAIGTALARARAEPPLYAPSPDRLVLDEDRFGRLIDIAGPGGAQDLLVRLAGDLSAVERGLVRGLSAPDPAAVRAHTHVLIALAGAVGATELQRLAEGLNGAAHRMSEEAMALIGADALVQLDHLIHFVAGARGRHREAP